MRSGIGRRIIDDLGRTINLVNQSRGGTVADDWGDWEYEGSTLSVKGVVDRSGAKHNPDASGAIPQDQAEFLIKDNITVRDGGGSLPASFVLVDDQRYEVQGVDPQGNGVKVLTGKRS